MAKAKRELSKSAQDYLKVEGATQPDRAKSYLEQFARFHRDYQAALFLGDGRSENLSAAMGLHYRKGDPKLKIDRIDEVGQVIAHFDNAIKTVAKILGKSADKSDWFPRKRGRAGKPKIVLDLSSPDLTALIGKMFAPQTA